MRIFGIILIVLGLLICLTIIGIPFGLFLMFIGTLCAVFGGRHRTTITNVVQVSSMPGVQMAQVPQDDDYRDAPRVIEPPRPEPRLINSPRPSSSGVADWRTIDHSASAQDSGYAYDRNKWNALVEYDADIRRIVDGLEPYGPKYIDQFAAAYLALNDKEYLPMIVKKILETARQEKAAARSR
jgi:hypothetical protein